MIQTLGQISDNMGLSEFIWHKPLFAVDIQPVHSTSSFCILLTVFLLESSLPLAFHDFTGMHANDRKFKKGVKFTRKPCRRV
jgi:hypothetical protein